MLKVGSYARVWKVKVNDGHKTLQISTSRKNPNGNYFVDFSGWVEVAGAAKNVQVQEDCSIVIKDFGVTLTKKQNSNGEWIQYTNFYLYDFDNITANNGTGRTSAPTLTPESLDSKISDKGLPF